MSDEELWWCPTCDRTYEGYLCPVHGDDLVPKPADAPEREPVAAGEPEPAGEVCWRCGERALNLTNENCHECHATVNRPALFIRFPAGEVLLADRNTSVELGRAGTHGRLFASHPNVSRRHATVGVDADGDAWIEPFPEAPNGTFINDHEIMEWTTVKPGDKIRFATDRGPTPGPVTVTIRRPAMET